MIMANPMVTRRVNRDMNPIMVFARLFPLRAAVEEAEAISTLY
jgi:hypothetical protein